MATSPDVRSHDTGCEQHGGISETEELQANEGASHWSLEVMSPQVRRRTSPTGETRRTRSRRGGTVTSGIVVRGMNVADLVRARASTHSPSLGPAATLIDRSEETQVETSAVSQAVRRAAKRLLETTEPASDMPDATVQADHEHRLVVEVPPRGDGHDGIPPSGVSRENSSAGLPALKTQGPGCAKAMKSSCHSERNKFRAKVSPSLRAAV
jgi:hypothetical protein